MKICLSKEACLKNKIDIGEVLLLLAAANNVDLAIAETVLVQQGYITAAGVDMFSKTKYRITKKGAELLDAVVIDSEETTEAKEDRLSSLALRLKEIFPKGKKDGTNYYWAEGTALIVRRLKLFFKKYGNTYTDEQIVQAAQSYVKSFNGSYTYMKLLKYFIFKEKKGVGGDVEGESELINYIENAGQEDDLKNDWTNTLI